MTQSAPTLAGRLLCAAGDAYGISPQGEYTATPYITAGAGWSDPSQVASIFGGSHKTPNGIVDINAARVGQTEDGLVVAFRGTLAPAATEASILDWFQDIFESEPKAESPLPGKVHHGFWNALNTLWDPIETELQSLNEANPGQKIYFTGHSKGGPMASLAAARAHYSDWNLPEPTAVETFASPHPGDATFTTAFASSGIPVTRYENYLDLVPLLPPTGTFAADLEKLPKIGKIFEGVAKWNYAPLGTLQYIKEDLEIIPDNPLLMPTRIGELIAALADGKSGLERIAAAHSHDCGGGYMGGVVPKGVCPI